MRVRGFTLLEVLVAVSILGLALTVILSSQVGLFSSSQRARNLTLVTGLARCKMSELEAKLLKEGYPFTDLSEESPCCQDEETSGYRCAWKVEKVELPESEAMSDDGGSSLSSSIADGGPISALLNLKQNPSAALDGGLMSLGGALGEAGGGGIASLLMGFVYPTLQPMLEASIRKVTVSVAWQEGLTEKKLEVVEFVTDPQQGGLDPRAALLANQIVNARNAALGAAETTTSGAKTPGRGATTPTTGQKALSGKR